MVPTSSSRGAFERRQPADVVDEVLQADLDPRPHDAMVRTKRPPGAVSCAPNTCSMRARMRLFARFAAALAFDSG